MTQGIETEQGRGRAVGALADRQGPARTAAEGWEWVLIGKRMWFESARRAAPGEVVRFSLHQTPGGLWTVALVLGARSWVSGTRGTPEEATAEALTLAGGVA